MSIHLHIERLVLEGVPLERRHGPLLQAAVERELARLLRDDGPTLGLGDGGSIAAVDGGSIRLAQSVDAGGLGEQIAMAVYGGFGGRL
jgi:hypothetical protein